ncbi:MAG: hypothetical protein ABIH99_02635 [Candidatus Micrarchaeota archaeon]
MDINVIEIGSDGISEEEQIDALIRTATRRKGLPAVGATMALGRTYKIVTGEVERKQICDALIEVLTKRDVYPIAAAMEAICKIGDRTAIERGIGILRNRLSYSADAMWARDIIAKTINNASAGIALPTERKRFLRPNGSSVGVKAVKTLRRIKR